MSEPSWIEADDLIAFNRLAGIKSMALLESAVAAPLNHPSYGGEHCWPHLFSHLAWAIAKNHAFADGNKRTATVAMLEFLYLNGLWIALEDDEERQPLAELVEQLTADEVTVAQFSETLAPYLRQV